MALDVHGVRKNRRASGTSVLTMRFESCTVHHIKTLKPQLFHPIGTQCVIGVQLVRAKARRKLMHLSLRLAFARTDCTPMTHCVPMGRNS